MKLYQDRRKRIKKEIEKGRYNPKKDVDYFLKRGNQFDDIKIMLNNEIEIIQKEIVEEKEKDGYKDLVFIIAVILGLIGSFLQLTSPIWYISTVIIISIAAFFAHRDKPIAGIISCVFFVLLMPLACNWWFEGREKIAKIEVFIPTLLVGVPAYFLFEILDKTYYD